MGWNNEEIGNIKNGMTPSSKILLLIIGCIFLIIIILMMLLMTTKQNSFKIYIDGATVNVADSTLLSTVNNVTYVNIEEFSKLVGYEYHKGEYKSSIIETDKCYVEGQYETASFYLNENKVYKLAVKKLSEQYKEYVVDNPVIIIDNKMYASIETIAKAFNVLMSITDNELNIYTLSYFVTLYDTKVKEWGYTGILEESFENQKAILQGFLVVKKEGGLYKIIDIDNTKEIVLDRYKSIEFLEHTEEFLVEDSSAKFGIINLNGTTKIEPIYESISMLDKEADLYIVQLSKKYGVVKGNGRTIIYPEYDSIGINNSQFSEDLLLNELIPVSKEQKWGAFNKEGKLVLNLEYDEFGYSLTSIEINGVKELVKPVLYIERADGLVVKKAGKYGLVNTEGNELVQIAVDGIYAINNAENEEKEYFMLYNGEELNVIERLIKAGVIEENVEEENSNEDENIVANNYN